MLDKENLKYIKNILNVTNNNVDLTSVSDILTSVRDDNYETFFNIILDYFEGETKFKDTYLSILRSIRDNNNYKIFEDILSIKDSINSIDSLIAVLPVLKAISDKDEFQFYKSILPITNKNLDTTILENVLKTVKHHKDLKNDIYDSFSNNQLEAKTSLLDAVKLLKILNKDSTVVIWGSWYGSILVPKLAPHVKQVLCLDMDKTPIQIGKKKLFDFYENVEYQKVDVFEKYLNIYKEANLIINTSCEHMPPMKEWPWFGAGALEDDADKSVFRTSKLPKNCYFAFQSNNMFGIEGHINCVNSLDEFKSQLPERAEIRYADEIEDTRGTRYMLIGKFNPL